MIYVGMEAILEAILESAVGAAINMMSEPTLIAVKLGLTLMDDRI